MKRVVLILIIVISIITISDKENKINKNEKKVIVIGTGISGLAAANELKNQGIDVVVLEAQDRIGGRLRTDRSLGVAFDEGASWIHTPKGNPLTDIANKAGAKHQITDDNSYTSYDKDGRKRSSLEYEKGEKRYYDILEELSEYGDEGKSFEEVYKNKYPKEYNDRLQKFFLSTYLTFDTGATKELSSIYYNAGEEYDGEDEIITNGYDLLPQYLSKGLDIKLNERVSAIDYSGDKVKITTSNSVYESDYVIVTVPLGVLKKNVIKFNPELPSEKKEAISNVGMNCVNKYLLVWDKAFWDIDKQFISYTPDVKDKFNYFLNITKIHPTVNALMTFAYDEYAKKTETMSDEEVTKDIMDHLSKMYGNKIPQPKKILRSKWCNNENSYGAYSFTAIDTKPSDFDELSKSIDNKVFFAGEHTSRSYFSNAHGAYLSGIREANKIKKFFE